MVELQHLIIYIYLDNKKIISSGQRKLPLTLQFYLKENSDMELPWIHLRQIMTATRWNLSCAGEEDHPSLRFTDIDTQLST